MTERLPQVKPEQMIRALERLGFVVRRITGSHNIMRHPVTQRIAVVPAHAKDLKRGLVFGILKQAGVSREDFIERL